MERRGFLSGLFTGVLGAIAAFWTRLSSAQPPRIEAKSYPKIPRWIEDRKTLQDMVDSDRSGLEVTYVPVTGSLMVFLNGILLSQARSPHSGEYKVGMSEDGTIRVEVADLRWGDVITLRYQTWDGVS